MHSPECRSYDPKSAVCRDGFVQRPFCSGHAGCIYCSNIKDRELPACLKDELPSHLAREDGSPLFYHPDETKEGQAE